MNKNPGPDYNPILDYYTKQPSVKIGKTKKQDPFEKAENYKIPGPGQYVPTYHQRGQSLSYSLGGKSKYENKIEVPGPGSYCEVPRVKSISSLNGTLPK